MYHEIEILPLFLERFEGCFNPEVTSIQFCQSETTCYLEITLSDRPVDKVICPFDDMTKSEPEENRYENYSFFYTYYFIEMNVDTLFKIFDDLDFLMIMPDDFFSKEGAKKILDRIYDK